VMAQVKVGLRGAALTSSDPNVIFTALDQVVNHLDRTWPAAPDHDHGSTQTNGAGFGGELLVSALLGVFDPATGDLQLASAGHYPPAVVRRRTGADPQPGSGRFADYAQVKPGPPLGITGTRPVIQIVLNDGDALVAHTGGLLQPHSHNLAQGRSRLLRVLNAMSATAVRSISQHVVDTMVGDRGLEHDCAMLVVVRDSQAHKVVSALVPPHTIAVRGARRWARSQLESWGVNQETISTAVMCVSELVTNVVQHAGTAARVTMELADQLLVTVEDTGTWSAPRTGSEDHSAAQGRGLALVAAVSDAMGYARGFEGSTVWFELLPERDTG
jgi:anti-sigma regulatory factor (Ser/Thr protein kinase)